MAANFLAPPHPGLTDSWSEIDLILDEIVRLSRSESSSCQFHSEVLSQTVRALGALGGLIWIGRQPTDLQVAARVEPSHLNGIETLVNSQSHREFIETVAGERTARIVGPGTPFRSENGAVNPTDWFLVTVPLTVEAESCGVVELVQSLDGTAVTPQGSLAFLKAVAELISEYHRNRKIRDLENRGECSNDFQEFSSRIHRSLDIKTTAFEIANEGRRFVGCDRLSVLRCDLESHCTVQAVSGVDAVDLRSNAIHSLEALASDVAKTGESHEFDGGSAQLPPNIRDRCLEYCEKSHARRIVVVPMNCAAGADPEPRTLRTIGVLVAEQFGDVDAQKHLVFRVSVVARHGAIAMSNSIEHQGLPLISVLVGMRRLGLLWRGRGGTRLIWGTITATAIIAALMLIKTDFDVPGRGTLQPQIRRDVFARTDGVIQEILTEHGERCAEGAVLARLTKPQLEQEFSRVLGEMQTARKRLEGIQASRLENVQNSSIAREKYNHLTAEEEEAKEQIQSLQRQHELLVEERGDLIVRSPITGQVLTWNVRQVLESRPVQRGELLLTVADVDGPWGLELQIPDDQIGSILDARKTLPSELKVSFLISTESGVHYQGILDRVATAVESRPDGSYVLATVLVDREQIPRLRPGAVVVAKIHCGRRSLGYVWFHGLWNAVRMRLLF